MLSKSKSVTLRNKMFKVTFLNENFIVNTLFNDYPRFKMEWGYS